MRIHVISLTVALKLLFVFSTNAQDDCITLDSSQKKLYLNGNNNTLLDNALRVFKLNSIGKQTDSLIRIWILDTDYPKIPTTWRVRMIEFGKKGDIPTATLNILEWNYENEYSLPVKCVKRINLAPVKGWFAFERDFRFINLPLLYQKPVLNKGELVVDFGMLNFQFLFGTNTYSVDVSGIFEMSDGPDLILPAHKKRIVYMFWLLEKHFLIKPSVDLNGYDFLEDQMKSFKLRSN